MHRLPSKAILLRFRIASCVVMITALGLVFAIGCLAYGMLSDDFKWIVISGWCFGGLLLLLVLNALATSRLRCPLCMVPPLQNRGCSKHRSVKRILGSHRLKVATSILFSGYFSCPYCGEKTAMEARSKSF
ncbi:MAG: hypothetical protein V4727_13215 [Verrucomicrobiota bacterium]